jgi:hypothetical protein
MSHNYPRLAWHPRRKKKPIPPSATFVAGVKSRHEANRAQVKWVQIPVGPPVDLFHPTACWPDD